MLYYINEFYIHILKKKKFIIDGYLSIFVNLIMFHDI